MNIIVRPYGGRKCYCRPDTTWERENKDFYVPDHVGCLYWTPIAFARISKAGKCIGKKFVGRYYDSFNFGILLYTDDGDIAFSSCTDHTSLLPSPLYNNIVMEGEENFFEVSKNGEGIFRYGCGNELKLSVEDSIVEASGTTSLRIGDFVAVELAPLSALAERDSAESEIKAFFCENTLIDIKIIF